ncbi:diguanylate cyclase [Gallaecimonas sp. GXIMD4217]|uniref:GGDEF domain-containing protein n=1 Tax=Gallaecimonas sp. GXIMD4217 TaxID=3131927 RepID=UPI00311ABB6F
MAHFPGEAFKDDQGSATMTLQPLNLSFSGHQGEFEQRFLEHYFQRSLLHTRLALCIAALYYGLFAIIDPLIMPEHYELAWLYRFYIFSPLTILIIGGSFLKGFRHYWQPLLLFLVVVAGIGMLYMAYLAPPASLNVYHSGLFLTLFFSFSFIKLQFKYAFTAGLFLFSLFIVHSVFIGPLVPTTFIITNLFLLGTNLVGMFAAYQHEYGARQHFFLTHVLREQNSDLAASNRLLARISNLDGLTKVANRRSLDDFVSTSWLRCQESQHPLTLMMCDIDYFKSYNDRYGHLCGDDVLVKVANVLKSTIRVSDSLTARYGGEEFVLVLPNVGPRAAQSIAERIRKKVEELNITNEGSPLGRLTISIGVISQPPGPGFTIKDLYLTADKALYLAKNSGRNKVIFGHIEPNQAKVG